MILAIATCSQAKDVTVKSPNGALVVTVSNNDGRLTYGVTMDGQTVLRKDLTGEVDRESEGVVQLERILSAYHADLIALHKILEHFEPLSDRLCKALLLNTDNLRDKLLLLLKLGISRKVFVYHGIAHFVKERLGVAEKSAVTRGASEQTAQNIALALV